MTPLRLVAALAIATTACIQQTYSEPTTFPEPAVVSGPPGGQMDPEWQAQSSGDYADATVVEPSAAPDDPGFALGTVTDAEIDVTLDAYGEWVETDDYGSVWRPYATEVGADFTPYESCGSWIWTDWGWTFSCDWDWGWLPFHYGQWGWFDDYWAWVPDHQWSPAWVEWRDGGGYVGWRPQPPTIRDHRDGRAAPYLRDHRDSEPSVRDHRRASTRDSHWRFAAASEFGKPHIRAHLFKAPAEGLRVTAVRSRLELRGNVQAIRAASLMRNRFANGHARALNVGTRIERARPVSRPSFDRGRPPTYDRNPPRSRAYDRAFRDSQPSVYQLETTGPVNPHTTPSRGAHLPPGSRVAPERTWQPATPSAPAPPWRDPPVRGTLTPATPSVPAPPWRDPPVRGTLPPATPPPPQTPTWGGRGAHVQGTFTPASPSRDERPSRPSHPTPSSTPTWGRPSAPPSSSSWSPSRSTPPAPSSAPSSSSSSSGWRGSSSASPPSPPSHSAGGSSGGGSRSHRR